ncbi:MAG: hypothetical protein RIC55_19205 [Pirellulaceae bacterium]
MATNLIPLTRCKSCRARAGAIAVDSLALTDVRNSHQGDSYRDVIEHELVIKFGTLQPIAKPCPHLVHLMVDLFWGAEVDPSDWATSVDWINPVVREVDPDDKLKDLWQSLAWDREHEEFLPDLHHAFEQVYRRWTDSHSPPAAKRCYEAHGVAVFAEDIPAFVAELFRKEELRQAAILSGRDTRREWAGIKAEMESALEAAVQRSQLKTEW